MGDLGPGIADAVGSGDAAGRELDQLFLLHAAALEAGEAASRWWFQMRAEAQDATTEASLDTLLRDSLQGVAHALGADAVAVLVADDSGDLVARVAVGLEVETWSDVHIAPGVGIAGRVLADRRPVVVPDLSAVEVASSTLRDSGVRSLVAVPVFSADRVFGVLHADSYELDHFSDRAVRFVALVADRLAAAFERVRLWESERSARALAEETAERLGRLQRITAALSGDLDLDRVAEILLSELAPELGQDANSHTIWLSEGDKLSLLREWEAGPAASPFATMTIEDDLPGPAALRARRPLWLGSSAELRSFSGMGEFPVDARSVAVLPMMVGDEALGVLAIGYPQERRFAPEERNFLSVVAQQAAHAFHRARLRQVRARGASDNAFLADLSAVLGASLEVDTTLRRTVQAMVPRLADLASIHLVDDLGILRRVAMAHRDPSMEVALNSGTGDSDHYEARSVLLTMAAASGRPVLLPLHGDDLAGETAVDPRHEELLRELGIESAIAVPLSARGEDTGLLGLMRLSGSPRYTGADLDLAAAAGQRVSQALDNAMQHRRRVEVARALQASLLPPVLTPVPGVEVAAVFHPATAGVDVGGDFYDLFPVGDGRWVLMIGDVSGSGPAAAALTAQVRHGARVAARVGLDPASVVGAVNTTLDETTGSEWFCTMIYAEITPHADGVDMQLICAGHPQPLVVRGGTVELIVDCQGPLLGVMPSADFAARRLRLGHGHAMVLVTDGATEARDRASPDTGFYGEDRLVEAVARAADRDAQGIVDAVASSVLAFSGGQLGDDLAVVAMRALPPS